MWIDEQGVGSSTGYDIEFYSPVSSQRVTRHIDNSYTFRYVIKEDDRLNKPEETLVHVGDKHAFINII